VQNSWLNNNVKNKKLTIGQYEITQLNENIEDDSVYDGFMMTTNNYYFPKVYDLTHADIKEIKIWFRDGFGEIIPIIKSYRTAEMSNDMELDDYEKLQAVFKIECELAIVNK
jgi:hypothetical protein